MLKKIILATSLFFISINSYSYQFDKIVTFGDSLSDNGNLYRFLAHIIPKSPPYYEGRFSNGPVWVETLFTNYFHKPSDYNFQDFAVGGAGTIISSKEELPYTISLEVDDYLYLHNYHNKDTSLFIFWIGANDYLKGPTNVDMITTQVITAIGNNIEAIIANGGVMVMVANLPDLGLTPEARQNNTQQILTQLTLSHNQKLSAKYNDLKLRYPNVKFAYFDVYSLLNEVIANPQKFYLTNTTDPCYTGGFTLQASNYSKTQERVLENYLTQQLQIHKLHLTEKSKKAILTNPSLREVLVMGYQSQNSTQLPTANDDPTCLGYLFWDHLHPTTAIHQYLAQYGKLSLDTAGITAINSLKS